MTNFIRSSQVPTTKKGNGTQKDVSLLPKGRKSVIGKVRKEIDVRDGFRLYCPDEWGIPDGASVNVMVEVMPQGTAHHTPFLRHPFHGPFSNYGDMRCIGIRVEWLVNGVWKSAYFQSRTLWTFPKPPKKNEKSALYRGFPETPYITIIFIKVLNLFSALFQVQWQPAAPKWMAPIAILTIREVAYNHTKQRLDVTRPAPI
ncbi:hypothetical protein V1524DRAFT_457275 [Lipomyces starkeyi]